MTKKHFGKDLFRPGPSSIPLCIPGWWSLLASTEWFRIGGCPICKGIFYIISTLVKNHLFRSLELVNPSSLTIALPKLQLTVLRCWYRKSSHSTDFSIARFLNKRQSSHITVGPLYSTFFCCSRFTVLWEDFLYFFQSRFFSIYLLDWKVLSCILSHLKTIFTIIDCI